MSSSHRTRSSPPPTAAQKRLSAQRAAAARARIADAQRRRRIWTVVASVGTIVVLVLALVVVKVATSAGSPKSGASATAASRVVAQAVASVPIAAFDAAGAGAGTKAPQVLTGAALTAGGKPRVLFIGGEYCPYCAAERWPLAVALSRFGTVHGLGQTSSSANDVYPNTPTLSFHGATYTSRYLSFTGDEAQSNKVDGNSYAPLDQVAPADQALWKQIGGGSYPFLDIGGRWASVQAAYSPQLLHGMTHEQVARALSDAGSEVGQTILGAANEMTAAMCTLTHDKPASVCTSAGVTSAATKLRNGG